MKITIRILWTTIFVVILSLCFFFECSILFTIIGASIDASKTDQRLNAWQIKEIEIGSRLKVFLHDGEVVSGKYQGLKQIRPEEYSTKYQQVIPLFPAEMPIPAPGDTIIINTESGIEDTVKFLGFDPETIWLKTLTKGLVTSLNMKQIKTILDLQQNEIPLAILRNSILNGTVPSLSMMTIESNSQLNFVNLDKIFYLEIDKKHSGATTGFIIGLTIDAILVAVIITESEKEEPPPPPPSSGEGSCPFVYSYDGKEYVLDSETFSGSVFPAAQRFDWDNLDHLKSDQGIYRLKLTNELPEIQYVDELKLVVVDHPFHTRVVPSLEGDLHLLSGLQSPITATDFSVKDILNLVKETDEQQWMSNPVIMNTSKIPGARDGMILEFDRPQNSELVKLIVNVKNTPWSLEVESHLYQLYGTSLNLFYQVMNNSAGAREKFKKSVIREAMLNIYLWNGEIWKESGYVWFVGPHIAKDQVLELDIHDIPGEILKVKLESAFGFWIVNSVQVDYLPDLPVETIELSPTTAFDQSGRDIRKQLYSTDSNYHIMEAGDQWAEIFFMAPPLSEGKIRTAILKSSGYYTPIIEQHGNPQWQLLSTLGSQSGAFGTYTLQLLRNDIEAGLDKFFKSTISKD